METTDTQIIIALKKLCVIGAVLLVVVFNTLNGECVLARGSADAI